MDDHHLSYITLEKRKTLITTLNFFSSLPYLGIIECIKNMGVVGLTNHIPFFMSKPSKWYKFPYLRSVNTHC